ncbi:MAG: hypothetical protein JWN77_1762 [Frankiales bacterium]|jgi:DNA-binding GntR family transcriptional regulator|nr:hypothetical protein [Frankiales bacterium]
MPSGPGQERSGGLGLAALSLRAQAAELLQARLVQGFYVPGQRLSEAAIAEELEISRGPIREALGQLSSMGLVRHATNKGWHVPKLTRAEIEALYELREACEGMAGRLAAQRRTPEDVERLREVLKAARPAVALHGAGYPQGAAADLHGVVLAIARNPLLEQRARETQQQLALARYRSAASEQRAAAAFEEHQRIVEAIAKGHAARAQQLVAAHIRNSAPRTTA